ncbi:hypothetical protein NQ317_003970, partial [Molorchus minor]
MDPVGPWYASYNRLAGSATWIGEVVTCTTTLLLLQLQVPHLQQQPNSSQGASLTPPPLHSRERKPLAQAAASKQSGEFHPQAQAFFEQGAAGAWQQNSPFGILPHESVVATTTSKTYENFNAHFAAAQTLNNHINSQITKAGSNRSQSPQVSSASTKANTSQANSSSFYQVPVTLTESNTNNSKTFPSSNQSNIQQQQQQSFKQQVSPVQIQTKAQSKIYSEIGNQQERQRGSEESQSQSSPISFSIMDAPGRLNYSGSNSSGKRPPQFQHNYRHYQQQGNSNSEDFQRSKSGSDYNNSNGPDCGVVVPRRPSPLQAHSQASPLGHAQSPAYPMYNSPMNSISSPQQSSSNQVTPPSPLDVSVPRPSSQTGTVAYPSVITRALNPDKNFPERYERSNHGNQQNHNCWDDRQGQGQRKFQNNQSGSQSNSYNSNSSIEMNRGEQNQQRIVIGVGERQQYFETNSGHQVMLQDLSSCRGDPMSIVKNLQQQQSCQVPQPEIKTEVKPPAKRRKSSEKPNVPDLHTIPSRIPPPAHSSGANQPQQNGAYFDLDRWNLPPPNPKIFATQALHQQHQGLMVPHPHGHHPPPPLPYFSPFPLAPHPTEYASTVELTPIANYNEQSPQPSSQYQQPPEDHPKVVVPNIEEELNFLSEDTTTRSSTANHHHHHQNQPKPAQPPAPLLKPTDKPTGTGSDFMSSFLKFLQGEKDTSPPPSTRVMEFRSLLLSYKPLFQPFLPRDFRKGDPQDDPRYFPLPKERKRNSFDSSDDGFSSDDDFFRNRKNQQPPKPVEIKEKEKVIKPKTKQVKTGVPTEKKKAKVEKQLKDGEKKQRKQKEKNKEAKVKQSTENLPKRESTKRAAKGKTNLSEIGRDEEPDEPPEFQDSDSDPAWTPAANNDDEDRILPIKKNRRGRPAGSKSKKSLKNLISVAAQGAGINEGDGFINDHSLKRKSHKTKQNIPPTLEDNIAASLHTSILPINDDGPFKPGEFVVIKSELKQEWPAIWRVDGKTLLQKYEPFEQNGMTLYRNISSMIVNVYEGIRALQLNIGTTKAVDICSSLTKVCVNSVYRAVKYDEEKTSVEKKKTKTCVGDVTLLLNDVISRITAGTWSKCILHVKKEKQRMWDLDTRAEALIEPVIINLRDSSSSDSEFNSNSEEKCYLKKSDSFSRVYTSWTPESKKQYMSVPVRYRSQGQLETIVEFLKNEITIIDHEYQEHCMKIFESFQDNFEVYIQTLISQALDSNFLMEIFQEKAISDIEVIRQVRSSWAEIDSIEHSFNSKTAVRSQ